MKLFNRYFFLERFSVYDMIAILVFIELSKSHHMFWLLGIIPAAIIGAAMSMRTERDLNKTL